MCGDTCRHERLRLAPAGVVLPGGPSPRLIGADRPRRSFRFHGATGTWCWCSQGALETSESGWTAQQTSATIVSSNFIRAKDLETAIEQELRKLQRRWRRSAGQEIQGVSHVQKERGL